MQPKNWRGKVINTLKKSGDLCIYRCVPPTHEYGTRPFLRWARSQGRSPHASGKAKNTFGPVGIPLFGAPQAPGNKPNLPEGGISLGGWPPEAGGTLQCRGTPGRTAQRWDGLPNATQELERKGHKHPKKERGPLNFRRLKPFLYGRKGTPPLSRHVNRKFFNKKWTQKISISLARYRLAKSITSIFIELFLAEVFCKCW